MKRSLVLILATLLVSAMGVALAADIDVSGKVISSTPSTLVIETDAGEQMTFLVDSGSDIPATMTPGDRVNIAYSTNDVGKYHATTVTMTSARSTDRSVTYTESDRNADRSRTAMNDDDHLPRTASPLPLIALIGALSVGAGLGLRVVTRLGH